MMVEITRDAYADCYVIRKSGNFWDYVGNRQAFMKLGRTEKERIFLTWKYGTSSLDGNREVESTDHFMLSRITDETLANMKPWEKSYWTSERNYDRACNEIKKEIGLFGKPQTEKAQKVIEEVVENTGVNWND